MLIFHSIHAMFDNWFPPHSPLLNLLICVFYCYLLHWFSIGSLSIFNLSSGNTISLIVYRWVTFLDRESYSATILPPSTGIFLSMCLSVHISVIMGTTDLFLFLFLTLVLSLFFLLSLFFFHCFLAYSAGFFSFFLLTYAFCCIFHCFEKKSA